jgi:hypothetical protein
MKRTSVYRAAAVLLPLLLAATSFAQGEDKRGRQPRDSQPQQQERQSAQPRREAPAGRGDKAQPRAAQPRAQQPQHRQPRPAQPPRTAPPASGRQPEHGQERAGAAIPRAHAPAARLPFRVYPEPRFYGYGRPRVIVPVIVYPRPYYAFRPRYWLGFGIYIGMPVPYPVMYGYPTYVYGEGIVTPMPSEAPAYGGISLEITPDDASVVVDGVYVGIARDFSPTHQPLTLTAGRHHIELQAPEQAPLAFDIDVVAGEVIPYRGTLPPQ